jgi:hypothetical protein
MKCDGSMPRPCGDFVSYYPRHQPGMFPYYATVKGWEYGLTPVEVLALILEHKRVFADDWHNGRSALTGVEYIRRSQQHFFDFIRIR